MDRPTSVLQIKKACATIASELMRIHPAVPGLGDKQAQDDVIKALFQLTKELETIKKRVAAVERQDTPEM
ncbi:MAG: hypothetical protein JWM68_3117 [Verrucomicrobiales bacterium]|nr:hypothetical protein [Verrucomicrobiales bacterium]